MPNRKCPCGQDFYTKHSRREFCLECLPEGLTTSRERSFFRRRAQKKAMIEHKGCKCEICGIEYDGENACIFDLHHLDPNEKDASAEDFTSWSWERIVPEIEKCILLCSNCHRKVHFDFEKFDKIKKI